MKWRTFGDMKNGLGIYECHGQLERSRNGSSRAFTPQSQPDPFRNRSTAITSQGGRLVPERPDAVEQVWTRAPGCVPEPFRSQSCGVNTAIVKRVFIMIIVGSLILFTCRRTSIVWYYNQYHNRGYALTSRLPASTESPPCWRYQFNNHASRCMGCFDAWFVSVVNPDSKPFFSQSMTSSKGPAVRLSYRLIVMHWTVPNEYGMTPK